jgi:hypothetical protein
LSIHPCRHRMRHSSRPFPCLCASSFCSDNNDVVVGGFFHDWAASFSPSEHCRVISIGVTIVLVVEVTVANDVVVAVLLVVLVVVVMARMCRLLLDPANTVFLLNGAKATVAVPVCSEAAAIFVVAEDMQQKDDNKITMTTGCDDAPCRPPANKRSCIKPKIWKW